MSQKKIIVIGLGILVLASIPILDSAFANTTITVGDGPRDVIFAESLGLIFVANENSDTVSIINATDNTVISTIPVGAGPIHPEYVEKNGLLYVSNSQSNNISVIDVATRTVVDTIPVTNSFPWGMDFNSNNDQLYVSGIGSSFVTVIDTNTNTVIKEDLEVGVGPTGVIVNQGTNTIYVADIFTARLSVIDGSTNTVIETIQLEGGGRLGIDESTNRIFVGNPFSDFITVVDGNTNTVITKLTVGSAAGEPQFDPLTNFVLVPVGDSLLFIIDADTLEVLGAIPAGPNPTSVEVVGDAGLIYVNDLSSNVVTIVDLGSNFPPTANAGPDQIVDEGTIIQLDGSASRDFDGDPLTFNWNQTKGPSVNLITSSITNPTFEAPDVNFPTLLEFELIVNDGIFDSISSFVNIFVRDITTFIVDLEIDPLTNELIGDITIENFPADSTITFDFTSPPEGVVNGTLDEAELASANSATDVTFVFTVNSDVDELVSQNSLLDPALFFEINAEGIDFSNPQNFPPGNFPRAQFSIDRDYETVFEDFSDGCPAVPLYFLDETTDLWTDISEPGLPNTNVFYAVDTENDVVLVYDGNTYEKITEIFTGIAPRIALVLTDLNKVYVSNLVSNTVSVINSTDYTVQGDIPVPGPGGLAFDPTSDLLYVGSFENGDIFRIDVNTDQIVDVIPTGGALLGIFLQPDLQRLYAIDTETTSVIVYDTVTTNEVDRIDHDNLASNMIFNPNNNLFYLNIFTGPGSVLVFDTNNEIVDDIPVGSIPSVLGINTISDTIYVANRASGTVSVIDGKANIVLEEITLAPGIVGLNVVEKMDRVFVVNEDTGFVSIIDGSKLEVIDEFKIQEGIIHFIPDNLIPNPVRDPGNDESSLCAYIAKLPHLSKFAVGGIGLGGNTAQFLAGGGGGGSSAPISSLSSLSFNKNFYIPDEIAAIIDSFDPHVPLAPMDPELYEDFDFPLTINYNPYNGYPLAGYENTIEPNVVKVGTPVTLEYTFFTQTEIQHFSLYSGLYGSKSNPTESNIQILFNKDMDLEIHDPFESITDVNVTKNKIDDLKTQMVVEFTPTKENSMKDLIVRVWDPNLSSMDTIIRNAFEIIPEGGIESSIPTYEEPVIEELQSQSIPIWIKNNAAWWSEKQIEDSDFVAGIEYLIKNGIINIPGVEVGTDSVSTEIPDWIQNNAGWWADSLITDGDFVEAMQWLVANGVIQI